MHDQQDGDAAVGRSREVLSRWLALFERALARAEESFDATLDDARFKPPDPFALREMLNFLTIHRRFAELEILERKLAALDARPQDADSNLGDVLDAGGEDAGEAE